MFLTDSRPSLVKVQQNKVHLTGEDAFFDGLDAELLWTHTSGRPHDNVGAGRSGPTREFDGIGYYITGGGGAELRPVYRKSGGECRFMKAKVAGDNLDIRVITEPGELTARCVLQIGSAGEPKSRTSCGM